MGALAEVAIFYLSARRGVTRLPGNPIDLMMTISDVQGASWAMTRPQRRADSGLGRSGCWIRRCPQMACKGKKANKNKKACYLLNSRLFFSRMGFDWWRFTDSNRGPVDYDSIALTD